MPRLRTLPAEIIQFAAADLPPRSCRPAMLNGTAYRESTFGYLSVIEAREHGSFGGYLIVSQLGRPVEFHCTAPIKTSRAQQILYGPTLAPFLIGEQICGALLEASKTKPCVILTDCPAVLDARSHAKSPVVQVLATDGVSGRPTTGLADLSVGRYELQLPFGYEHERDVVTQTLEELAKCVDLLEPFGRIHEAIREAQRIGSGGAYDEAA